ncbi:MAG TPA: Ig-like domain-containing protein [Acidimicrobiia bacterium]|nr:Ig-like domain-containing protein [Acidimicrobiia bacterium]
MLVVAIGLTGLDGVEAIRHPATLVDRASVTADTVEPGFPIQYVGVIWDEEHGHDHGAIGSHGFVRFEYDGEWGEWIRLIEDGADKEGIWASGLVSAHGAEAYQIRGLPADAHNARAVALNTTDGPLQTTGYRPADTASAIDNCLSRAEWGADESLRFDSDGNEIWLPAFYPVQTMTVHHTATQNDDPDPAATVRAIYEYHAVDQGWGDIGYHMLIDEQGRVYEGRWSGTTSTPCSEGGDGSDFAHDANDDLVTAGHTGGYNSGNFGVALLGEFTTHPRFGAEPKQTAVDALIGVLAEFSSRHGLDPHAVVDYVNPVNGDTKTVDMISGHRDWTSTECPGERLYVQLPTIRDSVAAQMTTVTATLTSPTDGATVSGDVTVSTDAGSDAGVSQVEFFVDGSWIATDTDGSDGWGTTWDSTGVGDGDHAVSATATDADGQTASDSVNVSVDNVDDPPAVAITNPANGTTVSGSVDVIADASDDRGINQVEFFVDGSSIGIDTDGSDGWSATWDTTVYADADHTVSATATDSPGQTSSDSVAVTVDNSGGGEVTLTGESINNGQTWTAKVTVSGSSGDGTTGTWDTGASGGCTIPSDATSCTFELSGIHKSVSSVTYTDDTNSTLTITISKP